MKQYTDGERTIFATDRAFEVIYKKQGFEPVTEDKPFERMKVDELRELAAEKGIEGYEKLKKDELLEVLRGAGEDDPTGTAETTD